MKSKWRLIALITLTAIVLLTNSCNSKNTSQEKMKTKSETIQTKPVEQLKPTTLGRADFSYLIFKFDPSPEVKTWETVVPPADVDDYFFLAGTAGDEESIEEDKQWSTGSHSEPTCAKFKYSPSVSSTKGWAGKLYVDMYYPHYSEGISLEGVSKITFWARGEQGGEKIEFRFGGTRVNHPQPKGSTGVVVLKKSWQKYSIDIAGSPNLDHVFSGFSWITNEKLNPSGCVFYLDDMQFN